MFSPTMQKVLSRLKRHRGFLVGGCAGLAVRHRTKTDPDGHMACPLVVLTQCKLRNHDSKAIAAALGLTVTEVHQFMGAADHPVGLGVRQELRKAIFDACINKK